MYCFVNDKLFYLTILLIIAKIISILVTTNQFLKHEIHREFFCHQCNEYSKSI